VPVAIITGSESGIGRATAVALAERGMDVGVTWFRDESDGHETAREVRAIGRRAELRHVDLSDPAQGTTVVAELADALGGVDVLVNNAGTNVTATFLELSLEQWRRLIDVDLTAAFAAAQEAARRMVAAGRGGRIINVTSIHERVPLGQSAAYCAAKGGLGMLTKVMALELAQHGILVNAVAPGEIATALTGAEDRDPRTIARPGIPAGRPGDAREVAAAIAFLASDDAGYVTGESLVVDGGLLLMAAIRNQGGS
jgi:NAD(P)-dependent dehydrogenase (short-subunit alcohol dehydrogenase family)